MATVSFTLAGMAFEYDDDKNQANIKKHGIDFRTAARVFFDYNRIEMLDDTHSDEERYNTIGDISVAGLNTLGIGSLSVYKTVDDVIFVVYTDRVKSTVDGECIDVTRLISARFATDFERGIYYGKA